MFGRKIHRIVLILLLVLMGALAFSYAEAAQVRGDRGSSSAATLEERSSPNLLQSMVDLLRAIVKQRFGGPSPAQDLGQPVEHPYGDPGEGSSVCPNGCPGGQGG